MKTLLNRKYAGVGSHSALEDLQFPVTTLGICGHLEINLIETDESWRQPREEYGRNFAIHRY